MFTTLFYALNHSHGGGSASPNNQMIHKNDTEPWRPWSKDDFLPPLWTSYTMPAAL
jgi:hypothetical protein